LAICPSFVQTNMTEEISNWVDNDIIKAKFKKLGENATLFNPPEQVANDLIKIINMGENGSAWAVRTGEAPELIEPAIIDFIKPAHKMQKK
jgi:hypothetical protein